MTGRVVVRIGGSKMFITKFQYLNYCLSEARQILRLGIPLIVAHIAMVGLEVIDTMMAGRVSTNDLAGLAIGVNIWLVIELFMGGWISATTARFARFNGAKQTKEIRQEAQQAMLMAFLIGCLAMFLIWSLVPLIPHLGASEEVTSIAQHYLKTIAWGMPASGLIWVVLCLCEGCGDTRLSMFSSLIVLALNVVLDYIFVFGKFGFPALGAVGCAWTTTVIYFLWMFMCFYYVLKHPKFKQLGIFSQFNGLDFKRWKVIFLLGLPISLSLLAEEGFFSVSALIIAPQGPVPLGAHQITLQIAALVLMCSLGIGQATAIRMSNNMGAQKFSEALGQAKVGLMLCLMLVAVVGSIIGFFPAATLSLFTSDKSIVSISLLMLMYAPLFLLFDSAQVCAAQVLRSFEDTTVPMLIQVSGYWLLGFPLAYSLGATQVWGRSYGVYGFWVGFFAGVCISAFFLCWRLRKRLLNLVVAPVPS